MRRLLIPAAFGILLLIRSTGFQRPLTSVDLPAANAVIKIEFGLAAKSPAEWAGTLTASAGEVLSTWGWNFILPDRIEGASGWNLRTRWFDDPKGKYKVWTTLPAGATVVPNGVFVALNAPDSAQLTVNTNRGKIAFTLGELITAGRMAFFDGDMAASVTPATRPLTRGQASQHDFPSIAAKGDDVFVAWTTYHNEANFVYLAHRKGGAWKEYEVSRVWGDYYASAVAIDGSGNVTVVWGEFKDNRWRLVYHILSPASGQWSNEAYVAPAGRRQMFPRMTTDAAGFAWLVWQEFGSGNFDVFASRLGPRGWSTPIRVSESPANDWQPAVAAASDGTVWVAWDSYDAGNYDILLRPIRNGRAEAIIRVTNAPTFDAHVSLAADQSNDLWLAWEEAGPNWGKDSGTLGRPGTMLFESRRIRVVRYDGAKFSEPPQPLETALPPWAQSFNSSPQVAIGANGLPYVIWRRLMFRPAMPENDLNIQLGSIKHDRQPWYDTLLQLWEVYYAAFDGARWTPARQLSESEGRCAVESGWALSGDRLVYVWPTDGRTYSDPYVRTGQLRYAELESAEKAAESDQMRPFLTPNEAFVQADPNEQANLKRLRAFRWPDKPPLRLFRGDLHRHTDISGDGVRDGDILDTFRYAIDAAALDFMAITDHSGHERLNYYRYDWWRTRQISTLFDTPESFASFFGYERTVPFPGGHRNIISTRRDAQPFRISDEEFLGLENYGTRLFPFLKANGDFGIPHTTATTMGTDWRANDPAAEPVVEIFQGARRSYEEPNGPEAQQNAGQYVAGFVQRAWEKGLKLGVIASSDHTSTHQSFACVYAPEFTAKSIHDSMKRRRTFAATDNIIVRFEGVAQDGRRVKMGEELKGGKLLEMQVEIQGTAPISKVELIGNGKILLARAPDAETDRFSFRDTATGAGQRYYYVRIIQKNRQLAWSSPIWVYNE